MKIRKHFIKEEKRKLLGVSIIVVGLLVVLFLFIQNEYGYEYVSAELTSLHTLQDTLKLDTVKYGEKRRATFLLRNAGSAPLLIRDVRPSCGCTDAKWSKRPVRPGQEIKVQIVFEPNSLGRFQKSIDVLCNTAQQVHKLYLKGVVVE